VVCGEAKFHVIPLDRLSGVRAEWLTGSHGAAIGWPPRP
jgi:hypothetical protein